MKRYFGTLIIILAFFGFTQEQKVSPNQEIVIQFNDDEVSAFDAKSTVVNVKKRLQDLGVNNIEVKAFQNGQLKITYYSATDAASIKDLLSKNNTVELDITSRSQEDSKPQFPSNKKDRIYNLEVFKIQDATDSSSGLDGKLAIELKSEIDRFFNPSVDIFAIEIDDREKDRIVKIAYKLNTAIAIAIDNTSYNIPEVRAGPQTNRIS